LTITRTPAPLSTGRDLLVAAAIAIEPLLNRVVFTGHAVAEHLTGDVRAVHTRSSFTKGETLQLLSTTSLDRVATELQRLGLTRIGRTSTSEQWRVGDRVALDIVQVACDESDSLGVWLEYAALLTLPLRLDEGGAGLTVHISVAPALLALNWARYRAGGESPLDSAELEEIVVLAAGRVELAHEVRNAPSELRAFVAHETAQFLSYDGAEHVIRAALPGVNRPVSMVRRVLDRLHSIVG
jgi:hypothetical protein